MEVRPRYKLTEVGVIPEDWHTEAVANLVETTSPICYGVVQVGQHTESGVPIVAIKFVKEIAYAPLHRTAISLEKPYSRSRPRGGDILISIKGTIGRVGIVPNGFQGNISRELARLRISEDTCSEYIAHQLEAGATQERIMQSVVGTTRLEFSIAALRQFQLPLPPTKNEQTAIAKTLSNVDALLGGLERIIAKKHDLKQAATQQLLTGQTRLPGFHGKWEMKTVGELATVSKGTQLHSSESKSDGHFPHYNGGISPSGYTDKSNMPANTIAISEGGNSCGYVQLISQPFWCGGHCYAVVPKGIDNGFIYHALKGKQVAIMGLRVGSGLPNVQKTALSEFKLEVPQEQAEQSAIAAVLSDMDAELAALEAQRRKTRALKQAMMQELLTGKTRLVASPTNVVAVDFAASSKSAPAQQPTSKSHNWQINEAVVVAVLVKQFGSEQYPLGRKRCTKLAYLMHRHVEHVAEGYRKKAAGPYNPDVKYKGPESIAQKNGYIRAHRNGNYSGFVATDNIGQAEDYFDKWYGQEVLGWLEQFRKKTNDELELLATVDMAVEDLKRANLRVGVDAVKAVIRNHPEWEAKLEREIFSDINIARAIRRVNELFSTVDA